MLVFKFPECESCTKFIVNYQNSWHGIFIIVVQMTVAIIRNNNPCQFTVHPKMGIRITHKYQQM